MEKTGHLLKKMNKPLSWAYLEQYDSYISQHGDTNYITFVCISGKRIEEDVFELRYQSEYGSSFKAVKQLEVFAENKNVWNMNGYESIAYTDGDVIYYPASDTVKNGLNETYYFEGAYYLKDGIVHSVILDSDFYAGMEVITNPVFWLWIEPSEIEQASVQKMLDLLTKSIKAD